MIGGNMVDTVSYRDTAKKSILGYLEGLKQCRYLNFVDDNINKKLIFRNVPSYGITDDELLVVTDNIIKFLEQNPDDAKSLDPNHLFYRYIEVMIKLIERALVNIVGATNFVDYYDLPEGETSAERTYDTTQLLITITDILNAIYILGHFGFSKDKIDALRNCIIIGLRSPFTNSPHGERSY